LVCDWRCPNSGSGGIYVRGTDKNKTFIRLDGKGAAWNRAIIRMKGDRLTIRVNDKVVTDNVPVKGDPPARGAIALAHIDGVPVQFRNVFIRELKPDE
jgi:hypothetical protein